MTYTKRYTKPVVKKIPRPSRDWSKQQRAVFNFLKSRNENLHIEAKAGSGKTATLVEMTYLLPSDKKILCCAFGKDIQLELEARVRDGVTTATMHSIGFMALRYAFKTVEVNENKLTEHLIGLVQDISVPEEISAEFISSMKKAVNFCKVNLASNRKDIEDIINHYEVEFNDYFVMDNIYKYVEYILEETKKEKHIVDYTDMVWLPIVYNLSFIKYDYVFIDEAQDLNKCQIQIALRSRNRTGRIISLGDTNQAIFGFSGADSNSISNIIKSMNSTVLPLSVCYRCPKSVIEISQEYCKEIEAAPNAEIGEVIDLAEDKIIDNIKVGDVILSRLNAPLVKQCMNLLKNKIPANIMGRDIGENIIKLVEKSKATTIPDLITYINKWKEKECEKLIKKDRDTTSVIDKAECIIVLAEECDTIQDINKLLNTLYKDKDSTNIVTLSSTHKYKGKQADNIFVLIGTYKPFKNQEETNLAYVATTRAIKKMYMVQ